MIGVDFASGPSETVITIARRSGKTSVTMPALAEMLGMKLQPYQRRLLEALQARGDRPLAIHWPRRRLPDPSEMTHEQIAQECAESIARLQSDPPARPPQGTADRNAPDWAPKLERGRQPR